jgi:hypothetical protein
MFRYAFHAWLSRTFKRTSRGGKPRHNRRFRPALEALESRLAPAGAADLTISSMVHSPGTFQQGDSADTYSIIVIDVAGSGNTAGQVTLTDTLPTGLSPTAVGGPGWTTQINGQTVTATRSDVLTPGNNYPTLTLTVAVAGNAPASVTNTATVSGGGDVTPANNSASDLTAINGPADLFISSMSHSPANLQQGETGDTYSISVSDSSAAGTGQTVGTVTVTDVLPAGLTPTAVGGPGWTGQINGQTVTATRSDVLTPGNSYFYPVIVTVSVAANAPASLTNTATVSGGGDVTPGNDSASDPTTINGPADLFISSMSHSPASLQQGETGDTYSISVSDSSAAGTGHTIGTVTVTDVLPIGLAPTAVGGPGWTGQINGQTVTATRNDVLTPGNSYFYPVMVTVSVAANAPASVTNTATVSGGGDVTPGNDSASDPTTINGPADLFISSMSHSPAIFQQGETGDTYSIYVSDSGVAGTGHTNGTVTVTDVLPTGLTPTAVGGPGWTGQINGQTVTATRNDVLTPGSGYFYPVLVTVAVAGNAPASVTNTATVSGGGDVTPGNDTASDPTTIVGPADLTISSMSHSPGNFQQGDPSDTYDIGISDVGIGATAGTVTVADVLPTGLTPTAASGTGWTTQINGQAVTATRADVLTPSGSYPTLMVTVGVAGNAPASLTNTATVSGGGDVTPGNDTASDPTTINGPADLTISMSHFPASFQPADPSDSYSIAVSDLSAVGTGHTNGTVTVTDVLPTGLTYAGPASVNGWAVGTAGQTVTATRSDILTAGNSYPTLTLTVAVAGNAPAGVTNIATVSGGGDVTPGNDTTSDSTTINAVTISVGTPTVTPTGSNEGSSTSFSVSDTFNDTAGALGQPFTAVINWGDNTTSTATVSGTGNPFGYAFNGSHTYAQSGSYNVTVSVTDTNAATSTSAAVAVSVANVAPTVGTPTVTPTNTTEGSSTSFSVSGTFSDPASALDQPFSAVINWGDNTTSTATVSGSGNPFDYAFNGNHTYAQSGPYNITVSVTDKNGATGTSAAVSISVANVAPTVGTPTVSPTSTNEGTSTNFSVSGTFSDPAGALDQPFTAVINWGDNSTSTTTVSGSGNPFGYAFNGNHTYAQSGPYNVTVSVTDKNGGTGTSAATAVSVANVAPTVSTPTVTPISTSEGSSTSFSVSGTFTDPAGVLDQPFTAVINWGDSTTSTATVSGSGNPFSYAFSGSHTYADAGSYNVTVSVTDKNGGTGTSAAVAVSAANMAPTVGTPTVTPTSASEGSSTSFSVSGTFTDPAGALDQPYSAVIHWGDNTTSTATVSGSGNPFGYGFSGSHTYAEAGSYNVTVSVTDTDGGTGSSAAVAVSVANVAPTVGTPTVTPTSASEGSSTSFSVSGTFTDPAGVLDLPFTAVINWGDNTTSTATVSGNADPFAYAFSGNHTYADAGSYNVTVSVTDTDGGTGTSAAVAVSVANVAPMVGTPAVSPTSASEGSGTRFIVAGTFTDPAGALDQPYSAVIHWGDNTTSTAPISGAANPFGYIFNGSHTYALSGSYNVTVSVADTDGGTGTSAAVAVSVANVAPTVGTPTVTPTSTSEGSSTSFSVSGTFTDPAGALDQPYSAVIHWGDNTTSTATVSGNANPFAYGFSGSHTYADAGSYNVTVSVTDKNGATDTSAAVAVSVANVAPTVGTPTVTPTSASEGSSTSFSVSGTFTDPAGVLDLPFTAVINWGDNTTSTATVSGAANPFGYSFNGSHTYALSGSYNVTVSVTDKNGGTGLSGAQPIVVNPAVAQVPPISTPPPFVSVAVSPYGEVMEVVFANGALYQFDAFGVHFLGLGVRAASVAFSPFGEVLLVTYQTGTLYQYDLFGAQVLGGGVQSASVAFGPAGEVIEVVYPSGTLTQYDAFGAHDLLGGVKSASVAFGPAGEVLEVVSANGTLTQYDAFGANVLLSGVVSAGLAFTPTGAAVLDVILQDGSLDQFDLYGFHPLGRVS